MRSSRFRRYWKGPLRATPRTRVENRGPSRWGSAWIFLSHGALVVPLDLASQGVGEHPLDQVPLEVGLAGDDDPLQLIGAVKRLAAGERAGRVERLATLLGPPAADGVEVLQAVAQRVDLGVAGRALGLPGVPGHLLAERLRRLAGLRLFLLGELAGAGWGRGGRRAEDDFEDVLPSQGRARPVGVRGQGEHAAHPHQTAPVRARRQGDPADLGAGDARDLVVRGEVLVEVSVVGVEQFQDAPVAFAELVEEGDRLVAEGLAELAVEGREELGARPGVGQLADLQPRLGEVVGQGPSPGVEQHPPDLGFEGRRVGQLAPVGQVAERRVGHRRPEEVRQADGQLVVADLIGRLRPLRAPVALDPEQEVGRDQGRLEHQADRVFVSGTFRGRAVEQGQEPADFFLEHRPSIGQAEEPGDDPAGGLAVGDFRAWAGDEQGFEGLPVLGPVEDQFQGLVGGGEILLHQDGREDQGLGQVGEARPRAVAVDRHPDDLGRLELDAEEAAEGPVVLVAGQLTDRRRAGVEARRVVAVERRDRALEPGDDPLATFGGDLRLAFRRHLQRLDLLDHPPPDLPTSADRRLVVQLREVDPALGLGRVVALDAMPVQEGPDLVAEDDRVGPRSPGDPTNRHPRDQHGQPNPPPRGETTQPPDPHQFPSAGRAIELPAPLDQARRPGWIFVDPIRGEMEIGCK